MASRRKTFKARPSAGAESGFSVLEALVAMAILTSALIPLLALQGQFVRTTESLERAEIRLAAQDIILAHIKTLNFAQSPEGQIATIYGEMSWTSQPAQGPIASRDPEGFASRYRVTLFDVDITITPYPNQSRQTVLRYSLQAMGWRPTKSIFDTL